MICPNCGASNSTRATFCRRCRQRLPVNGAATGVTYRQRGPRGFYTSGGSRLPVYAAIILAATGFIVGAVLIGLARPAGPTNSFVAGASSSPVSTLPIFVQPTPTPSITPPPLTSFPSLPTPIPETPIPSDLPTAGPSPSPITEPTPTPTPTPPTTPRPTKTPRSTASATPTPTPTAPPVLTCAAASGTPSDSVFVGTGNPDKKSKGWCIEVATFRVVFGSQWGSADLLLNGKGIASYSCSPTAPCQDDTKNIATKLAKPGATLSWRPTSCIDEASNPCTGDQQFMVTIEVGFEKATTQ